MICTFDLTSFPKWLISPLSFAKNFVPVSKYESDYVIMTPTATATSSIEFQPPLSPRQEFFLDRLSVLCLSLCFELFYILFGFPEIFNLKQDTQDLHCTNGQVTIFPNKLLYFLQEKHLGQFTKILRKGRFYVSKFTPPLLGMV